MFLLNFYYQSKNNLLLIVIFMDICNIFAITTKIKVI